MRRIPVPVNRWSFIVTVVTLCVCTMLIIITTNQKLKQSDIYRRFLHKNTYVSTTDMTSTGLTQIFKMPVSSQITSDTERKPLFVIFTTFRNSTTKDYIYKNTIRNWALLKPFVQPVVFYTDGYTPLNDFAVAYGWKTLKVSKVNPHGLPTIKDMFLDIEKAFDSVFYGYCNGDILFEKSLINTLNGISRYRLDFKHMLVIGRRTNYKMKGEILTSLNQIPRLAKTGQLFMPDAEDFFITTYHGFPWTSIKDVVIGRPAYDNYLVATARALNVTVIDASNTLLAMHQTGSDGNFAGMKNKDQNINKRMIGEFNYYKGLVTCADLDTSRDAVGSVWLVKNTRLCE